MAFTNPNTQALAFPPPDERRCHGIVRSEDNENQGKRCTKYALKGTKLCRSHGGTASHMQKAARRREVQAKALAYASRMVAEKDDNFDAAQTLIDAAVASRALFKYWLGMCAALDLLSEQEGVARGVLDYGVPSDELDVLSVSTKEALLGLNRHGEAQIHPFVLEMNSSLDRMAKHSKMCLDANISERKVQLAEAQGQLMVRAIRAFVLELEQTFGYQIMARPEFPGMIRRHLMLASGN